MQGFRRYAGQAGSAIVTVARSFDPIIRFGGDEYVCGLGATDLAEASRRFEARKIERLAGR